MPHAGIHYTNEDDAVKCALCPHECLLKNGKVGLCGVRKNDNGVLYSLNYSAVTSAAVDPVEKKPLYHFYPGGKIFSIGTFGCNLSCPFCQNWGISQNIPANLKNMSPVEVITMAEMSGCEMIAYTYSEPVVWYEFVLECCRLAAAKRIKNVLVTNGYINENPLLELLQYIDAVNIDLKCFNDDSYKKILKGSLDDVKRSIALCTGKTHVEVTTLVVTNFNDNHDELKAAVDWLASVGTDIPYHLSMYYPSYKYNEPSTNIDFIMSIYNYAKTKLKYVYTGNIPGESMTGNTNCPECGNLLIEREGYHTRIIGLNLNICKKCNAEINIVL